MPVFLFAAGILLCVIGLFLIGFFIPNRDFSVGGTAILAGTISIVGGLLLLGVATATRELRKLAKALEKGVPATAPAPANRPAVAPPRPTAATPPARPAPTPAPPSKPAVVNTARNQRAEPRLDAPDVAPPEPPPPAAPTVADVTATRPRAGLFASIRGRAAVQAAMEAKEPPPLAAPPVPAAKSDVPEFEPDLEPAEDIRPESRSPLSALAARTAARLDLPRPVPDLPRAMPERQLADPLAFNPPAEEEREPEKSRNMFDTVWPTETKPPAEAALEPERKPLGLGADRRNDITPAGAPPEPRPEILKSGVIDGMAYTLYTDGSIEAQLPQGMLRFSSIDDLRAHLERH